MTTNEAAERLRFWSPHDDPEATDDFNLALREALAVERRNAGQCDGYAGDAGASAPRCESYAGHSGRHFIRFDGTAHEATVRRATVERIRHAILFARGSKGQPTQTARVTDLLAILDEEAAR